MRGVWRKPRADKALASWSTDLRPGPGCLRYKSFSFFFLFHIPKVIVYVLDHCCVCFLTCFGSKLSHLIYAPQVTGLLVCIEIVFLIPSLFQVAHFSKYGLQDSDEEEDVPPTKTDTKKIKTAVPAGLQQVALSQQHQQMAPQAQVDRGTC